MPSRQIQFAGRQAEINYPENVSWIIEFLFGQLPAGEPLPTSFRFSIESNETSDHFILNGSNGLLSGPLSQTQLASQLMGEVIHDFIDGQASGIDLHSAAVSRHGKGILLPGATGSGKSTLTSWLLTRGLDYLTDELVHIPTGADPQFESFTRPLNIKGGGLAAIESLVDLEPRQEAIVQNRNITMLPSEVFGATASSQDINTVSLIIFPRFVQGASLELEPLSAAKAGLMLMSCHVNARNLSQHGFPQITRLTRNTPAMALTYGNFEQLEGVLDELIYLICDIESNRDHLRRLISLVRNAASQHGRKTPTTQVVEENTHSLPDPTPRNNKKKLAIGMATYDDFDGVYFSVQAIRLYHPEVLDEIEILVIDNHPEGPCSTSLKPGQMG